MRTSMKLGLASVVLAALAACTPDKPKETKPSNAELVKRGEQLVTMGGCNDCHTPLQFDPNIGMPMPQKSRMLSGHPAFAPGPAAQPGQTDSAVFGPTMTSMKLPFGTVYAANLTPDVETGIGGWTEDQFVRALRTGKHQGKVDGRPILPPMPWQNLAAAPEADLKAVFAYLRTIPAIKNKVPDPEVAPPALAAIAKSYAKAAESEPPKL